MKCKFLGALLLTVVGLLVPVAGQAAELEITGATDSLTTGVLTVAHNSYGEFYAPAGTIVVRAADDATTATTRAFVRFFAANPSSTDLDGSTREKTGVLLQEGDVITIRLSAPGWIAIDGVTGTSQVTAHWLRS